MIVDAMISVMVGLVKLLMTPLPSLPAISTTISTGGDWAINTIGGIIGFLNVLYSAPLLTAIVLLAAALMAFEQIYWSVMWILKKIPILNIK